jgi:predicted transcriptional regulator
VAVADRPRPDRSLEVDETTLAVYDGLLRVQAGDAGTLAEQVGIDEDTAARALARLVEAGLARAGVDGSPSYRAEVPDALLDDLVDARLDDLEAAAAALRSARETAAEVRALYRGVTQSRNALEFERLVGGDEIATRISELSARTSVTLEGVMTAVPPAALIEQARDSEDRLARRGVQLRSLYRAPARRSAALAGHGAWLAERGGQIRTTAWPLPTQYVLFDRAAALVAFEEPEVSGPAAVVLTTREVITCLGTLFDMLWDSALPLPTPMTVAVPAEPSQHEREILELMHAGLKDEAIARELGVSTKTVRRAVSSLADRLGVKDRFSLGVLVGTQGWLRDGRPVRPAPPPSVDEHR